MASVACFFAGLCYAEFAAMMPIPGSAYSYAYATMGELIAWLIGWCLILEWLFSASLIAISWSGYVCLCNILLLRHVFTRILPAGPIDPLSLYFEAYPIPGAQKRVEPSHMMVTTVKPELVDHPAAR
jgi:amino acid transporter